MNEQKEVISRVNAEISHIESLMTNDLQQSMAQHEHVESVVQLPGDVICRYLMCT